VTDHSDAVHWEDRNLAARQILGSVWRVNSIVVQEEPAAGTQALGIGSRLAQPLLAGVAEDGVGDTAGYYNPDAFDELDVADYASHEEGNVVVVVAAAASVTD